MDTNIKFTIEHPDNTGSLSLLDFQLKIMEEGEIHTEFYRKAASRDMFVQYSSALPLGCTYNSWSNWGECSKSCDIGNRIRIRERFKGKGNEPCNLPLEQSSDCNFDPCKGKPSWSTWNSWSECSATCGVGSQKRQRICNYGLLNEDCIGEAVQLQACVTAMCEGNETCKDGKVWSDCANACPMTCMEHKIGENICQQSDTCIPGCRCPSGFLEENGHCVEISKCFCHDKDGTSILENFEAKSQFSCQKCFCSNGTIECLNITKNCCKYAEWTSWGSCSQTCGVGVKHRYRKLLTSGNRCSSEYLIQNETCTLGNCPFDCIVNDLGYNNDDIIRESACEICICENYREMCRPQPNAIVHANWTEWTQWTECSRSCQPGGLRSRTRFCSNPLPRCGGDKCSGDAVEVKPCNEQEFCCTYTPWSFWSSCSASCGPGIQTRQRQSMDKNNCDVDPINERKTCEVQPCEAACGQWSNWSSCSGDCNLGTRFRQFIVYSTESTNSLCKTKYDFVKCNLENKCNCSNLEEWSVIAGCEAKCEELVSPANSSFCENWNYGCKCINGLYRDKNGKCVRRDQCDLSCSVNGTIKMNQDIWKKRDDNCTLCQCIRGKIKCERICKIPVCQENEDLIYLDSNTCCPVCKPKNFAQCQMKYEFTYLENRTSQCRSTTEIKVPYCSGKCGLSTVKPALLTKKPVDQLDLLFENKCLCCKGKASKIKEVIALCGPDQEKTVMYYPQICSCECSRCQ
eukprot:XP_014768038.1 PREDICTED: SCO-spondin-like [Octopus bimaculoides]